MYKILSVVILTCTVSILIYMHYLYPPAAFRRMTQQALERCEAAVQTQDRAKIGATFDALLTDAATIHLEVKTLSVFDPHKSTIISQDFDKSSFLAFIENILYSLTAYDYHATLEQFSLKEDRASAEILFSSKEWGDGTGYYAGTAMQSRFNSETSCKGTVTFVENKAFLTHADCTLELYAVPKSGEERKLIIQPN